MLLAHATRKPLFLAVLLLGLLASAGRADDVPRGKYQVWGGNCSRSFRVQSAHDTVLAACSQVEALRKQGMRRVEVIAVIPEGQTRHGKKRASYTVFAGGCRSFRAVATTDIFWQAALVQSSLGAGQRVEIVTHFQVP